MMIAFRLLAFNMLMVCWARSSNVDELVSKANIYYQRPLQLGEPRELAITDVEELDTRKELKFIIHGFSSSRTDSSIRPLGHAYMANGIGNVFLADWKDAAASDYHSARNAVTLVATHLAKLMQNFIEKHHIEFSDVHLIGHSLGAHIAGGIGRCMNGTLGRITGLDPALPLFTPQSTDGLSPIAAQFVDVIHTDFPIFGDITPRGTVDFYPHFGLTPQPGCGDFDLSAISKLIFRSYSCSHNRAVSLYAESIMLPRNFPTLPCSMSGIWLRSVATCFEELQKNNISPAAFATAIASADESVLVYMGENVSKYSAGTYYVETYDAPPFGIGMYSRF